MSHSNDTIGKRNGRRWEAIRASLPPPNPSGLCMCGCGQPTRIALESQLKYGTLAGHPVRYLPGHNQPSRISFTINPVTGCWEWAGPTGRLGYAMVTIKRKKIPAHRYMYEAVHGPIPDGLEPDHTCRNRKCIFPGHLEPVTHTENMRRSRSAKLDRDQLGRLIGLGNSLSAPELSAMFGITAGHVRRLLRRHRELIG
jgi:hypothetical protein